MAKSLRRKLRQINRSGIFFAEERTRQIFDERTERLAARPEKQAIPAPEPSKILICEAGRESYGIPLDVVAEVLPSRECLPVPEGPPALVGLLGRNGQLVSVIDLGVALGIPGTTENGGKHFILLRRSAPRIALRVDHARGVEAVVAVASEKGGDFRKEAVIGYAKAQSDVADQERILSLLDIDRLLRPFLSPFPAPGASP